MVPSQRIFFKRFSIVGTRLETWNRMKAIFQDNKNSRDVYLENQFNALHLSNFTDISAYCQQLKSLKDQLANVDQIVSEQKLVLCIYGLRSCQHRL